MHRKAGQRIALLRMNTGFEGIAWQNENARTTVNEY